MNWGDITLKKMCEIAQTECIEDENERLYEIVCILSGKYDLSYGEFLDILSGYDFITTDIPTIAIEDKVDINGKVFNVTKDCTNMIFAQYVDFRNYSTDEYDDDFKYARLLSAMLIPVGHKYADGYDVVELINYLHNNANIVFARSLVNELMIALQDYQRQFPDIYQTIVKEDTENDDEQPQTEEKPAMSFMDKWWFMVMLDKVSKMYNCTIDYAQNIQLFEFTNVYNYILNKEVLENKIKEEAFKQARRKK